MQTLMRRPNSSEEQHDHPQHTRGSRTALVLAVDASLGALVAVHDHQARRGCSGSLLHPLQQGASEVGIMSIIQLNPHENMTVEQCAGYVHRNASEFQDLIAVGYDSDGSLLIRSSQMSRAEAVFMLREALDWARGRTDCGA
jgi:hypothetical protein